MGLDPLALSLAELFLPADTSPSSMPSPPLASAVIFRLLPDVHRLGDLQNPDAGPSCDGAGEGLGFAGTLQLPDVTVPEDDPEALAEEDVLGGILHLHLLQLALSLLVLLPLLDPVIPCVHTLFVLPLFLLGGVFRWRGLLVEEDSAGCGGPHSLPLSFGGGGLLFLSLLPPAFLLPLPPDLALLLFQQGCNEHLHLPRDRLLRSVGELAGSARLPVARRDVLEKLLRFVGVGG